jgi:citrate synthase
VLNAALVLLADHELAVSTLAARVAASARADPYSVVSTGLGVIAGGMHGAASRPVVDLLTEVGRPAHAAQVIGARLRRGERLPGLGHKVYRTVDPRAEVLLDLLCGLRLPAGRWAVVVAVHDLVRDRLPLVVNVDFALGAMVYAAGMDVEAAEAMFSIARTAGWLAHAIEEYAEEPLRFRPRAAYTGPALAPTPPRRARPGTGVGVVRP